MAGREGALGPAAPAGFVRVREPPYVGVRYAYVLRESPVVRHGSIGACPAEQASQRVKEPPDHKSPPEVRTSPTCISYFGVDVTESLEQMEEERIAFLYRAIAIAHAQ
jgi:hypothetical protein